MRCRQHLTQILPCLRSLGVHYVGCERCSTLPQRDCASNQCPCSKVPPQQAHVACELSFGLLHLVGCISMKNRFAIHSFPIKEAEDGWYRVISGHLFLWSIPCSLHTSCVLWIKARSSSYMEVWDQQGVKIVLIGVGYCGWFTWLLSSFFLAHCVFHTPGSDAILPKHTCERAPDSISAAIHLPK